MYFSLYRDTSLLRHSFFLVLVNICLPSLTRTPSLSVNLLPVPRRKETVLKLCAVSWVVRYCALPVPRRRENIRKPCVVSSSMQNGVCPAALIAATQGNCPETLRRVFDCVEWCPSRAATQGNPPKTLRRGRYVKNIVHSVNNSLNL